MLMERKKVILVETVTALFILLFVYAATSKIIDFEKFNVELGKSPMLNFFPGTVAIAVPVIEFGIVILLIVKRFQYFALYCSFSLMVMFSVYIFIILKFSSYIPCSCGGILENMTWIQHLFFNIVFVVLGGVAILIYPLNKRPYLQ